MNRACRGKADPGCPYCSGRKVLAGYNDLATTHPDIAAVWHPRMNKRLKPAGVQAVSRKPAWWRGECGHVYQMAVSDRVRAKPGYCPYCSGRKRPERPIRLELALGPSARKERGEASQLWSFADIHEANGNLVSKNAAFDKQYLSGRYGADPYLTRIEEWE